MVRVESSNISSSMFDNIYYVWYTIFYSRILICIYVNVFCYAYFFFSAPDIRIVDDASHELRDRYYKTGSGIELACIVRPASTESQVPHPSWNKTDETLPDHVNIYHINGWALIEIRTKLEMCSVLRIWSGTLDFGKPKKWIQVNLISLE